MKNRTLPFGYEMQNGIIQINDTEMQTVIWIFTEYLNGKNMKNIAESLAARKIEYLPDTYAWNKNRIKRMIEDRRYTGSEIYPQIISQNIFRQANTAKENRRTTKNYIVDSSNKPFVYTVKCACCGTAMMHRTDRRAKKSEQWHCSSEKCGARIYMKIEELKKLVTDLINEIIANPALAEQEIEETEMPSEISIMESEINRMLEQSDLNKDEIQNRILECATKKYEYCTDKAHITERLKADFEKTSPLSNFSMEVFIKTVSAVMVDTNAQISIVLKNGNVIKEKSDEIGNNRTEKESQGNPCKARIFGQKYP